MGCSSSKGKKHSPADKRGGAGGGAGGGARGGSAEERHRRDGGGVPPYVPDAETAKAYRQSLQECRRAAIMQGIIVPTQEDIDTMTARPTTPFGRDAEGRKGGSTFKSTNNGTVTVRAASTAPPGQPLPERAPAMVTVYQCQPLPDEPAVGKGRFSQVFLANMTVLVGKLDTIHPGRSRMSVVEQGELSMAKNVASQSNGKGKGAGSGTPARADSGVLVAQPSPKTYTMSEGKHYLIAMKDIQLLSRSTTQCTLDLVCDEVRRWTRISVYCPYVIQCIQMEYAFADDTTHPDERASFSYFGHLHPQQQQQQQGGGGGSSATLRNRRVGGAGGGVVKGARTSISFCDIPGVPADSGKPTRLRIYTEFAKYGTLRNYQIRDTRERFNRTHLHELTARAFMREVLLALLSLHDDGVLQYDICARGIFLNCPLNTAFRSLFPAYISDIPVGHLSRVPARNIVRLLTLLDPHPMPPTSAGAAQLGSLRPAKGGAAGTTALTGKQVNNNNNNNNNMNDGAGNAVVCNEAATSASTQPAPLLPQHFDVEERMNGVPGALGDYHPRPRDQSVMTVGPQQVSISPSLSASPAMVPHKSQSVVAPLDLGSSSPGATGGDAQHWYGGSESNGAVGSSSSPLHFANSGNYNNCSFSVTDMSASRGFAYEEPDEQRWQHESFRKYLEDHDYEEVNKLPLPSPHNGIESQATAELIQRGHARELALLGASEAAVDTAVRILSLTDAHCGGIALVCPHRFLPSSAGAETATSANSLNIAAAATKGHASPRVIVPGEGTVAPPQLIPANTDLSRFVFSAHSDEAYSAVRLPITEDNTSAATGAAAGGSGAGSPVTVSEPLIGSRRPLVKLNHTARLRRALAQGSALKPTDVPVHRFVSITHAAPEVLQSKNFSEASDIYAFAMTFIELVTPDGALFEDCAPNDLPFAKPRTRKEKDEYDAKHAMTISRWYNLRLDAIMRHEDAVREEQRLPPSIYPQPPPVVMPLPDHLSDECKAMLRWCLQADPARRPTAAELLRSKYFLLADWIMGSDKEEGVRLPEAPWGGNTDYAHCGYAAGLPTFDADDYQ